MTNVLLPAATGFNEQPLTIRCADQPMTAILHRPESTTQVKQAVLLIVGGPQYRVGSHRQFVLLARELAKAGIACMRFDYRGMGDSAGDWRDFSVVNDDVAAAMNALHEELPELQNTALWGLCDAASAALLYAPRDRRVTQLILLNPWVRSQASMAKTYLKSYYLRRLTSPELWRKVFSGRFNISSSLGSLLELAGLRKQKEQAVEKQGGQEIKKPVETKAVSSAPPAMDPEFLPKMLQSWQGFNGKVLLLLSGNDFVADEFKGLVSSNKAWKKCVTAAATTRRDFPECDHTFSSSASRQNVTDACIEWLKLSK